HRLAWLDARRIELLADSEAAGRGHDVRVLVEILVTPMVTLTTARPSYYARFLEVVRAHPVIADIGRLSATDRIVVTRLERALGHLTRPARRRRLQAMATTMFALLADAE